MKHGTGSETSTGKLQRIEHTVSSKLPSGYQEANEVLENVGEQWPATKAVPRKCIFENVEGVKPFSKWAMLTDGHCAHPFLKNGDVLTLQNMV